VQTEMLSIAIENLKAKEFEMQEGFYVRIKVSLSYFKYLLVGSSM
jgi:hypothetical protein